MKNTRGLGASCRSYWQRVWRTLLLVFVSNACQHEVARRDSTLGLPGANLFSSGDFSRGDTAWSAGEAQEPPLCATLMTIATFVEPVSPTLHEMWTNCHVQRQVRNGRLCLVLTNYRSVYSGPAQEVALIAGQKYALTFSASASAPVSMYVSVGHVVLPWTPTFQREVPVNSQLERFSYSFTPWADDARAGLSFSLSTQKGFERSDVCFADVSLRAE